MAVVATRSSSLYWPAAVTFTVYFSHSPAATSRCWCPAVGARWRWLQIHAVVGPVVVAVVAGGGVVVGACSRAASQS